jgi:hypothetical protein
VASQLQLKTNTLDFSERRRRRCPCLPARRVRGFSPAAAPLAAPEPSPLCATPAGEQDFFLCRVKTDPNWGPSCDIGWVMDRAAQTLQTYGVVHETCKRYNPYGGQLAGAASRRSLAPASAAPALCPSLLGGLRACPAGAEPSTLPLLQALALAPPAAAAPPCQRASSATCPTAPPWSCSSTSCSTAPSPPPSPSTTVRARTPARLRLQLACMPLCCRGARMPRMKPTVSSPPPRLLPDPQTSLHFSTAPRRARSTSRRPTWWLAGTQSVSSAGASPSRRGW